MSNGHVERLFSILKLIKTDRRNSLSEDHFDDLLRVSVDGPPLDKWQATGAIELWWKSKQRRSETQRSQSSVSGTTADSQHELQELETDTDDYDFLDC